ncbi:TrlF family AAA-like ATPase [Bacillus cereus]|nr:PHP domain-containing protein [Bacillus cereus]
MRGIKGARWYKADLHLHTPESKCFIDKEVTAAQWVERCIEQGLDCVAVTDHNTGGYIDEIKNAANGTGLTVFPGVEVTCSDSKVHMLILFDTDKGTKDVNHFLARLKLDINMFGQQDAKVTMGVLDVIKEAADVGAIVIPAHIDQYSGICETDHATQVSVFENENVLGVQAVHEFLYKNELDPMPELKLLQELYGEKNIALERATEWKKALSLAKRHPLSILTFSDNPASEKASKHGLWGIGQRYTWIKMSENINLESLRQALLLPESRIRNDFESKEAPYEVPNQWINSIKVVNTEINQSENIFPFNPQMTTIIGGRGTGKSSILRFIRGCFKYNEDLKEHDEIASEQEKFFSVYNKNEDSGVLNKDSMIEVTYNRYNTIYKIIASDFNGTSHRNTFKKWNSETNQYEEIAQEDNNALLNLFNFDIYSQKQVYEIAKKPNALRDKMDSSIEGMYELQEGLRTIKIDYLTKSSKIRSITSQLEGKSKLLADIEDKQNQLKTYRESDFEGLFNKSNQFSEELGEIIKFGKAISESHQQIQTLGDTLELLEINYNNISQEHKTDIKNIGKPIKEEFDKIHAHILDLSTQMMKLSGEFKNKVKESNWIQAYKENNEEFAIIKADLQSKGIQTLHDFEKLNKELTSKQEQLHIMKNLEELKEAEIQELVKLKTTYLQKREEITGARKNFIQVVLGESNNLQIEIKKFRDKKFFETQFRRIIQKPDTFNEDINKIVEFCFKGKVEDNILKLLDIFNDTRDGKSNDLYSGKFIRVIKELNKEQMDELMLLYPEDEIQVKYKTANSNRYIPLSNASAGQKTSAILTFLLSYGEMPLILDQPEDDLDNSLIYELIVERLKSCKSKRQLIIVTHNANIPVNGDSELVLALDSNKSGINLLASGSIEETEVRKHICKIMEGGEAAFKLRAKRYKLS